jgi:hypothetical protein
MSSTGNPLFGHNPPLYTKIGLKWQSELNSGIFSFWAVSGNRSYWGVFDHLFSDNGFAGTESETIHYTGRKTGLCIPFWLAKLLFYGLRYAEVEKGLF